VKSNRRVQADVSAQIALECVDDHGTTHHVSSVFGYDPVDPFAVTVTFCTPQGDLPWTFARDLLVRGLDCPNGDGDVHVWPSITARGRAVVLIELSSPDGHLIAQARTDEVHRFLTRTLALVPAGTETEHFDVDGLVGQLLQA
jgi:hypothetical protein